jgi:adenylosuccinate lyase
MESIPNVIANRYASPAMREIWSAEGRIRLERDLWIAVMKGQRDLGLPIPEEAIEAYEKVKNQVDLASIDARERVTRHDVKARIEEFCALAGHEHIHKGMTSRDLTENVEQLQVYRSLKLILQKGVAALKMLSDHAKAYEDMVITARTHNVAAQPTTLGKRISMFGEELLHSLEQVEWILSKYPARGIKGAVGTQVDMLTLFEGDADKVTALERKILSYLDIWNSFKQVGQIYPRSLDYEVVSAMTQLACGPTNFAKTLRLMSGHELASEGFAKGQVGSSAMPHKMNARSCERITGFKTVLSGYAAMAANLAGDQWNEGDVACSVVRRIMLPDTFFAIDGLMETFLTVLKQMVVYPAVISTENRKYFPFLATTTILMEAVKAGAGREAAHEAIKENAVATVNDLRAGTIAENDLVDRLAKDERLGLSREKIAHIVDEGAKLIGNAKGQVSDFISEVNLLCDRYPEGAAYTPGDIL